MRTIWGDEVVLLTPPELLTWLREMTARYDGIADHEITVEPEDEWMQWHVLRPRRAGACAFVVAVPPLDDEDDEPAAHDSRAGAGPIDGIGPFADVDDLQAHFDAVVAGRLTRWSDASRVAIDSFDEQGRRLLQHDTRGGLLGLTDARWRSRATRTDYESWGRPSSTTG